MKNFFEKNSVIIGVMICIIVIGTARYHDFKRENDKAFNRASSHIEAVMLTDRNCNDCHLGVSFINLFNNPAVQSNDNTINSTMDKAKIKRW